MFQVFEINESPVFYLATLDRKAKMEMIAISSISDNVEQRIFF